MLLELIIKNLAIIDNLSITFKPGLNVLSGETGAGKSIIVDALSLALGERASSELLRQGTEEGSVQALFNLEGTRLPEEIPIERDGNLVLRRVLSSIGKSRAYINDNIVNLSTLQALGSMLVDIHSQHEHQSLMNKETQLELLDSFGGLDGLKIAYKTLFIETHDLKNQIKKIEEDMRFKEQKIELLRYQVNEIRTAKLRPGEEEDLNQEYNILKNAARLSEAVGLAHTILYEAEDSCLMKITKIVGRLKDLSTIDPKLQDTVELLVQIKPLLEEAIRNLSALKETYNVDPPRLDYLNERLDLIERLKKKYGSSVDEILSYRDRAEEELRDLEGSEDKISFLKKELEMKERELLELARTLSERRKTVALQIEQAMAKELKEVALEKGVFKVNFKEFKEPQRNGIDDIEFEFSANPGEQPRPMAKIASGGELSRLMLCLKVILAEVDKIPVLIFDEVDAGIGGAVAERVAQRLKRLSEQRQVLCITHLPQIASKADHHIKVEKIQKKDSVAVKVRSLSNEERQEEIARMLSGKITDASLRHAKELLREKDAER